MYPVTPITTICQNSRPQTYTWLKGVVAAAHGTIWLGCPTLLLLASLQ